MWRTSETQKNIFKNLEDNDSLIVFDVETTGKSPQKDRIIQISAIKYTVPDRKWADSKFIETDRLNLYIKPFFAVEEFIEELTGITNEFLETQNEEEEVFPKIYQFFGDEPLVAAYNSRFDTGFLYYLYKRNGKSLKNAVLEKDKYKGLSDEIDVLKVARDLVDSKEIENFKLGTIVSHYGLDSGIKFHSAIDDAFVTGQLLSLFLSEYKQRESVLPKNKIKVRFKSACYWNKYGHKIERIYVNTYTIKVFYDIYKKVWGMKDDDLDRYDMEDLRKQIFSHYHVDSEEAFVKVMRNR